MIISRGLVDAQADHHFLLIFCLPFFLVSLFIISYTTVLNLFILSRCWEELFMLCEDLSQTITPLHSPKPNNNTSVNSYPNSFSASYLPCCYVSKHHPLYLPPCCLTDFKIFTKNQTWAIQSRLDLCITLFPWFSFLEHSNKWQVFIKILTTSLP